MQNERLTGGIFIKYIKLLVLEIKEVDHLKYLGCVKGDGYCTSDISKKLLRKNTALDKS